MYTRWESSIILILNSIVQLTILVRTPFSSHCFSILTFDASVMTGPGYEVFTCKSSVRLLGLSKELRTNQHFDYASFHLVTKFARNFVHIANLSKLLQHFYIQQSNHSIYGELHNFQQPICYSTPLRGGTCRFPLHCSSEYIWPSIPVIF